MQPRNSYLTMRNSDKTDALLAATKCPFLGGTNQLWRNQLMGHEIQCKGEYENVLFSVVHHPPNHTSCETMNQYESFLQVYYATIRGVLEFFRVDF